MGEVDDDEDSAVRGALGKRPAATVGGRAAKRSPARDAATSDDEQEEYEDAVELDEELLAGIGAEDVLEGIGGDGGPAALDGAAQAAADVQAEAAGQAYLALADQADSQGLLPDGRAPIEAYDTLRAPPPAPLAPQPAGEEDW